MLITDEYRALNAQKHATSAHFGTSGKVWARHIAGLAGALGAPERVVTILDYGCGKSTLRDALWELGLLYVYEYDPAIEGKDQRPEPGHIVACTDVLEHVEPDLLDGVLDDIASLAKDRVFFAIGTAPSQKTLADGRNAHLIVQPGNWWLRKLLDRWKAKAFSDGKNVCLFVGIPL